MTQLKSAPLSPTATHQPPPAGTRWRVNALLILVVVLLLLGLVVGAIYWQIHFDHQQALEDVQTELDRIREAREPITPEEMHRYHQGGPRPAEKAKLWLSAISALPDFKEGSEEETALFDALGSDSPLSGDVLARAQELLPKVSEAIKRSTDAASVDGEARFPIEFEHGINATTPHVMGLIRLARLIVLRHRLAIARGDAGQAIESLNLTLATAEALEFEPETISQATRIAILRMLFRELPPLLDNVELTKEQLAELQICLARIDFQKGVRRGLLGERAAGYHAFHYLVEDQPDLLFGKKVAGDGKLRRPADFRYYLDSMSQLLTAADCPLPEARAQAKRVDASVKEILKSGSRSKKRELAGSTLLLESAFSTFDFWANGVADRDCAVAAIAFRRYQLAHGKPPESLAALCPEFLASVPQDPFAKTPASLRLVVADDRFAIYSVGENGSDDRSLLADPKSADDSGIVVQLSLPPKSNSPNQAQE
jgi:hypothetical protein